jgi:hypothetical protein
MRRTVAIGIPLVLALLVAAPVQAGYLVIRVILEGSVEGEGNNPPGGPPSGPPGMGRVKSSPSTQPPLGTPKNYLGGMGKDGGAAPHHHDATRSLVVVVPVEEDLTQSKPFYAARPLNQHTNPSWKPKIHTNLRGEKYTTNLYTDGNTIQWYDKLIGAPAARRTYLTDLKLAHAAWSKTKDDPKPLFNLMNTAMTEGYVDEAMTYADDLLAYTQEKKGELPPDVKIFAEAYAKIQKGLKGAPRKPSQVANWQARLDAPAVTSRAHYALLYWDATPSEVSKRLDILEENFKGFYLWFATRGIDLPLPESPLIVVLPKRGSDVLPLARALDAPSRMDADGFYSPEHDVLVLSPERLDELGYTFTRQVQQMYQEGFSRDKLLAGDGPKINTEDEEKGKKPDEVARMQTIALVERFLEEQNIICTVSREGTRQLLYASGQLPRYVLIPEWLNTGAVNFFTRPQDPAFIRMGENKMLITVAARTGYGTPNFALQRYFKDLVDKKQVNPNRAAMLRNILTDAYFQGLKDPKEVRDPDPIRDRKKGIAMFSGDDEKIGTPGGSTMPGNPGGFPGPRPPGGSIMPPGGPPGGPPGMNNPGKQPHEDDPQTILRKQRARLTIKAQATSWALYYYLAKARPTELKQFVDELALMPRDLPLSGDAVIAAFCSAFKLDGSNASMEAFAKQWLDYMHDVAPSGVDIPLVDPKPPEDENQGNFPSGPNTMPKKGFRP